MSTLPVMWKLLIGDINLEVATILTFISAGGCLGNTVVIYVILSICRICIYHELGWFMEMDQRKMSRVIITTVFFLWLAYGTFNYYWKYTREDHLGKLFIVSIKNDVIQYK